MSIVIALTSGKGGVGKSNIAINLALALSERQSRVCVFDADFELASLNILLGISPKLTLDHLLRGQHKVSEIIQVLTSGIALVPAANGLSKTDDLNAKQLLRLATAFDELQAQYDHIIIDTGAGINNRVLNFLHTAHYRIVIITPEPTSLAAAYTLIKQLRDTKQARSIYLLVNLVKDYQSSKQLFQSLQAAVEKHLNLEIHYLGYLVKDVRLPLAVNKQTPVVELHPECPVSCCFYALSDVVKSRLLEQSTASAASITWQSLAKHREQKTPEADDFAHFHNSTEQLIAQFEQKHFSEEQTIQLAKPLLNAYLKKIHRSSETLYPALYNFLAKKGYPEAEVKELVFTLETIFEHTQGKPLRSSSHQIAKLLVDMKGSKKQMQMLKKALDKNYQRQFKTPLYDPVTDILAAIQQPAYSDAGLTELLQQIKNAFQQRPQADKANVSRRFKAIIDKVMDNESG